MNLKGEKFVRPGVEISLQYAKTRRMLGSKTVALAAALISLISLNGCSSVHVIQQTPGGGVVALHGSEESAREKADAYMRSQCVAGYEVLDDLVRASEHDRTERRITFRCKTVQTVTARASAQTFVIKL